MALADNTLLMRKGDGEVKSSLTDFHMATGEVAWPAAVTVKDLGEVDCPGESGVRVHFPDVLPLDAEDMEVEFKCRAEDCRLYTLFKAFRDYLTGMDGEGTELQIYSPHCGIGRQKVHVKSMGDVEFRKDNVGEYASLTVVFRLTDPVTDIVLAVTPVNLQELNGYWKFREDSL